MNTEEKFAWSNVVIKICGGIAVLSVFLPFFSSEYYGISVFQLFFGTDTLGITSSAIAAYVIILVFLLELMIALLAVEGRVVFWFSLSGVVLLILLRVAPGLLINYTLSSEIGVSLGGDIIQFGSGWWIMTASFVAATVVSLLAIYKNKNVAEQA